MKSDTPFTVRAHAFAGYGLESVSVKVQHDGTVLVYDHIAGHYTTCHSLGYSALRRIRRIARAAPEPRT